MGDEEVDYEAIMLGLEPDTYVEIDGMVLVCGKNGHWGCMSIDAWNHMRSKYPETDDEA